MLTGVSFNVYGLRCNFVQAKTIKTQADTITAQAKTIAELKAAQADACTKTCSQAGSSYKGVYHS